MPRQSARSARPRELLHPVVAIRRRRLLPALVRRLDAAFGRRLNTRRGHPALDQGLARLSRAADRGVLWFSIATLLLLFGRRRAALRGAVSLIAASILANLVGKQVFGGDRPLLNDIPVGRRLKKHPTSPSFPSGHSASAAGFATGVALESPGTGLAVVPVAALVSYSRLHTGAHWLSDVVGGVALGAGIAVAGKLIVPVPTSPQRTSREGGTQVPLPALPDGSGLFAVVNPGSGAGSVRRDPIAVLAERLPQATVHELAQGEDLAVAVRAALASADPPRVLGVCGGDGTVAAVAQLAREAGLPLLVLPGGTFNHFARTAGIESISDGIDALRAGEGVRVDVAELGVGDSAPITVLNTASVGIYPDFVAEREKLERTWGKWIAAVLAAVRVLRAAEPVTVTINGGPARVWTLFVGVNENFPDTLAPLKRRRLDDGLLDVRILPFGFRAGAVSSLAFGRRTSAALQALVPRTAGSRRFTTDAVTVAVSPRHGQPPGFAHDGEVWLDATGGRAPAGGYSTRLRIVPQGLAVYSSFVE